MKYLVILIMMHVVIAALSQNTLKTESLIDCELFDEKKGFDLNERLQQIKDLDGKSVTVYLVRGKDNKIKNSYAGKVDNTLLDEKTMSLKEMTSVVVVTRVLENGQRVSYFPLTDSKSYRIYLTACLEE